MDKRPYIFMFYCQLWAEIRMWPWNHISKRENYILKQYYKAAEETNIVSKGDLQGNITYANDKFVEVSQYIKEEVMGKSHSLLKGEESKEKFDDLWETIKSKKRKNRLGKDIEAPVGGSRKIAKLLAGQEGR